MSSASNTVRVRRSTRRSWTRWRASIIAATLLLGTTLAPGLTLKETDMAVQFKLGSLPVAGATDARLQEAGDAVGWVMARDVEPWGRRLSWHALTPTTLESRPIPEPLVVDFGDRPGWDVRPSGPGQWRIVSFEIGSAVAPLVLQMSGTAETRLVEPQRHRGIFQFPRFMRHAAERPTITAVDIDDGYHITLYRARTAESYEPALVLESPTPGILQDVRLLPLAEGYLLLVQRFEPGEHRLVRVGDEMDVQNSGLLEAQRLDRDFKPVGPVWKPFGDQPVYQFDADTEPDPQSGTVAMFAVTPAGCTLLRSSPAGLFRGRPFARTLKTAALLSSPSVLFTKAGLTLSVLSDAGTPQATLWVGTPRADGEQRRPRPR